jgi:hypothetical protein
MATPNNHTPANNTQTNTLHHLRTPASQLLHQQIRRHISISNIRRRHLLSFLPRISTPIFLRMRQTTSWAHRWVTRILGSLDWDSTQWRPTLRRWLLHQLLACTTLTRRPCRDPWFKARVALLEWAATDHKSSQRMYARLLSITQWRFPLRCSSLDNQVWVNSNAA